MAKAISKPKTPNVQWQFPLEKRNFIIIGIGVAVIILGYILMNTASAPEPNASNPNWNSPLAISIAPVLLVIGYCVIIPFGIIKRFDIESDAA